MSKLTVATVTTENSSTPLSLTTGNSSGSVVKVEANNLISVTGSINVVGDIGNTGNVRVSGALSANGGANVLGNLAISGAFSAGNNANVTGNLAITGALSVGNNANVTGNIIATGTVSMAHSFMRNRIINGDMRIDQRNSGSSMVSQSSATYCVDRFQGGMVGANGTMQRVSTGQTDFPYAMKMTGTESTTTTWISQKIESFNCTDLVGQSVTVSFVVAASAITGMNINLKYANSADNFAAVTSIDSKIVAINSTLTRYSVTFSSLPAGAANGLYLEFVPTDNLGSGNWTLTGVQLETGTVATPFERRHYGIELLLCQRYYSKGTYQSARSVTPAQSATYFGTQALFKATMRTSSPTITFISPNTLTSANVEQWGGTLRPVSSYTVDEHGIQYIILPTGITTNDILQYNYTANAEL